MTTGELLVALFEAYRDNDDSAFLRVGMTLIDEEKAKNHYVLANKLKKILSSSPETKDIRPFTNKLNKVVDLPKDKDNGTELVKVIYPHKNFNDIVLSDEIKKQLDNVIVEYEKKEILKAYGLSPKKKLLFCGAPGCGKTICAEAVANALDLPILYTCFDGLISSYLGETSSNIRKVFDFASKNNWVLFFDEFDAIGADRSSNNSTNNLLTVEQTRPIADAMIDYTLGIHLFRAENSSLAGQIRKIILTKIDDNSSMEAKSVQEKLRKNKNGGLYAIITSFGLANATLMANIEIVLLVLSILIIIFVGILGYQQIKRLQEIVSTRRLIHMVAAGGMRAAICMIVIFGLLAFIPTIFDVEGFILNIGYFLEIASGIFLELVIVGVVLFVISTITWQITSAE